jgi:hypothetical protein
MRNGRVEALGPVLEVIRAYESFLLAKSAESAESEAEPSPHDAPLGPARILDVRQIGRQGEGGHYRPFEPLVLEIDWECNDAAQQFHLAVGIDRIDDVQVLSFSSRQQGLPPITGRRGYRARLVVPEMPLLKGEFSLYVFLLDESALHVFDRRVLRGAMIVDIPEFVVGLVRAGHRWEVEALPASAAATEAESRSERVSAQPSR